MKRRYLLSAVAGSLLATTLAGGLAWASVPGEAETITGCYQKNEGQLRIVASTDPCRPSENPISWNTPGTKGPKGDPGATGRDGRDGADGTGVTMVPEPGGPNCAAGGEKVVAANGVAYVCNFLPPDPGEDD